MIKEKAGRLRSRCELWRPGNSFNLPNSFHSDLYYSFLETPWIAISSSSSPLDQQHVWQWLVPWLVGYLVVACLGNGDLLKEAREFGGFSSLFLASLFYGGISPHSWGIAQEAMYKSCQDSRCLDNTRLLTACLLHLVVHPHQCPFLLATQMQALLSV